VKVICPHCLAINNVPKKDDYKKANCGKCKNSLLEAKPVELTSSNIDRILENSDIPVVVDFWAPWCGPCKMMAPVFADTSLGFPLKALFAKVNTQNEQFLGSRFKIRSIPTLVVFKNGKEVDRVSGAMDSVSLENYINGFI